MYADLNPKNVWTLPGPEPPRDRVIYYDSSRSKKKSGRPGRPLSPPGFGLRVMARRADDDEANSGRAFVLDFRFAGRAKRLTLGSLEELSLAAARTAARKARQRVKGGVDPVALKRRPKGDTLAAVAADYLRSPEVTRLRSAVDIGRTMRREIIRPLGNVDPARLDRATVRAWLDRIHKRAPFMANGALAVLRRALHWAVERERIAVMPTLPDPPEPPRSRDRVLTEAEIRAVWRAADTVHDGAATKLLLLTAARRGEIFGARWSDVDGPWLTVPSERSKSGRPRTIPLCAAAVEILDALRSSSSSPFVFPGRTGKAKSCHHDGTRLWNACGVKGARLHDLRRTAASIMARLGVSRFVLARVLGHADRGPTAIYDRHDYSPEKLAAVTRLGACVAALVASPDATVEGFLAAQRGQVVPFAPGA